MKKQRKYVTPVMDIEELVDDIITASKDGEYDPSLNADSEGEEDIQYTQY
jgi:hypothetical protein